MKYTLFYYAHKETTSYKSAVIHYSSETLNSDFGGTSLCTRLARSISILFFHQHKVKFELLELATLLET